jgi:hypothetical protein
LNIREEYICETVRRIETKREGKEKKRKWGGSITAPSQTGLPAPLNAIAAALQNAITPPPAQFSVLAMLNTMHLHIQSLAPETIVTTPHGRVSSVLDHSQLLPLFEMANFCFYIEKTKLIDMWIGNFGKTSHYKRSPRPGYLQSAYKKLRRLLRDLIHYAKKHPIKVFMLVIMPLITGGALTGLLARFGVRLPYSVEKMLGIAGGAAGSFGGGGLGGNERSTFGQAIGRDRHGNLMFEREREAAEGPLSAFGGLAGLMGGAGSAYKVAKMFM